MVGAFDVEDDIVAGEIDLHHDVAFGHFADELLAVVFPESVDTVADTFRMGGFDGEADVVAEAEGSNEAGSEFACMERNVHLRIQIMEPANPAHLQGVIVHGGISVLRHDVVEAEDTWIRGG